MIDLVHIGDYKTGTSWWQQQVFASHPDIYYLDDPGTHPEIASLMHHLVDSRDLDFDAKMFRDEFSKALDAIDCDSKKKVICREALSGTYPNGDHVKRTAERLYSVFGEVKVCIVIREQFSMLNSIYSQYIKIGGTLSFEDFVYDPIVSPGLIEKLKYHKIINMYAELFGQNNIFVGLFEDFKSDNELFAKRVFEFIGCSDDWRFAAQELIVNPSLRKPGLEIQRFINRFLRNDLNPSMPILPLDRLAGVFLSGEKKNKLLDSTRGRLIYSKVGRDDDLVLRYAINFALTLHVSKLCERIQFGSKLNVPRSIFDCLISEFVESNLQLLDKYALPVDKYGWSL